MLRLGGRTWLEIIAQENNDEAQSQVVVVPT